MTETLNERLDRMELEIKSLTELLSKKKPVSMTEKEIQSLIESSLLKLKPKDRDISKEIKDEISKSITRDFVNKLYRGAK